MSPSRREASKRAAEKNRKIRAALGSTAVNGVGAARSVRKQLAVLLIAGAAIRSALVWSYGGEPPVIFDARDYDQLAISLVESGAYASESGKLVSLRPPMFPLVIAGIYKLVGPENYYAVASFHAALSLLTVLLTYRLGTEAYSPRVGIWAATGICFYPSLLAYNQLFLSEVLFTFFVTAGALLSVLVLKSGRLALAALLGLCLGLGALTRSILWLFAPLLCLGLAAAGELNLRRRLTIAFITFGVFAAVIAPWAWRNTRVQKTLTFVDVMGGRNVMMGNYEYTPLDRSWATISTERGDRAWHRVLAKNTENYSELTQGQIDKAAMRYGIHYFLSHPWQSLQRLTVKFFNFWQLEREIVAGFHSGLFGNASLATTIVAALIVCGAFIVAAWSAIFGALVVPPVHKASHVMLMSWVAFPCAIHSLAFAHSRYHMPFMPILMVYAAAALAGWSIVVERRRTWPFAFACLACMLLALSWVREFLVVDMKWLV